MKPASKDLTVFYYQLGTMLQTGVSIRNALTSLQETGPRPLRKTVAFLGDGSCNVPASWLWAAALSLARRCKRLVTKREHDTASSINRSLTTQVQF